MTPLLRFVVNRFVVNRFVVNRFVVIVTNIKTECGGASSLNSPSNSHFPPASSGLPV